MPKIITTKDVLERLFAKWGDLCTYPDYEFRGATVPMRIVCSVHGEFFRTYREQLKAKYVCPKCSDAAVSEKARVRSAQRFMEFAGLLSISSGASFECLSSYIDYLTPIKIRCLTCGVISSMTPTALQKRRECTFCEEEASVWKRMIDVEGRRKGGLRAITPQERGRELEAKYPGKYTYNFDGYTDRMSKVTLTCKQCGGGVYYHS